MPNLAPADLGHVVVKINKEGATFLRESAADTNSDGEIDLAEFKTIMRAYPEHKSPKK